MEDVKEIEKKQRGRKSIITPNFVFSAPKFERTESGNPVVTYGYNDSNGVRKSKRLLLSVVNDELIAASIQ